MKLFAKFILLMFLLTGTVSAHGIEKRKKENRAIIPESDIKNMKFELKNSLISSKEKEYKIQRYVPETTINYSIIKVVPDTSINYTIIKKY